jgi:hypothetical protein
MECIDFQIKPISIGKIKNKLSLKNDNCLQMNNERNFSINMPKLKSLQSDLKTGDFRYSSYL